MLIVKSIDSSVSADSTIAQGHFLFGFYSGLNLNQYGVASPFRTICTDCGFVTLS